MADFKTADLCDEFADRVQICEPIFRDYGGGLRFAGPIATVKCFEDNSRVRERLSEPGEGRVLVVDAGGSLRCAMLGDNLARMGQDNGWAGVLMYGCIRDSADIGAMQIGVKALGTLPLKSEKRGVGLNDVEVRFAGVSFSPGAHLYADEDGVIVAAEPLTAS
ncbi:MAG: ribonuclease E activity regulator RraA [Chromatiales bacterium]|jgi:regulator of ribonuclease activity A